MLPDLKENSIFWAYFESKQKQSEKGYIISLGAIINCLIPVEHDVVKIFSQLQWIKLVVQVYNYNILKILWTFTFEGVECSIDIWTIILNQTK